MGIAHELITRGWNQGSMMDEEGKVCLSAALQFAARPGVNPAQPWSMIESEKCAQGRKVLVKIITPLIPPEKEFGISHLSTIYLWNDQICTSSDEAIRVAKEADELLGW